MRARGLAPAETTPPAPDSAPGNRPCVYLSPHRDGSCRVPHRVLVYFYTLADLRCGLWPPAPPNDDRVAKSRKSPDSFDTQLWTPMMPFLAPRSHFQNPIRNPGFRSF